MWTPHGSRISQQHIPAIAGATTFGGGKEEELGQQLDNREFHSVLLVAGTVTFSHSYVVEFNSTHGYEPGGSCISTKPKNEQKEPQQTSGLRSL